MKHFKKNYLYASISGFFVALYLTGIINEETLTTTLQRIFVCIYLILGMSIFLYYANKNIIGKASKKLKIFAAILALLSAVIMREELIPKKYEDKYVEVTLLEEKNVNSRGHEAWITNVLLNNKVIKYSDLNMSGWVLQGSTIYANNEMDAARLVIYVPKKKELCIEFGKHAWSGIVAVRYNESVEIYDLYSPDDESLNICIPVTPMRYDRCINYLMGIGLYFLLYEFIKIILVFIKKYITGTTNQ